MVTHSKELIEQNYKALLGQWPTAPAGIYSAGLGRKESYMPIIYGGIDSMLGNGHLFGRITILVIDEAHLLSLKDTGRYKKFIAELKVLNPNLKVIGFTATPFRQGQGMLYEGEDAIFTDLVFNGCTMEAFNWFLDEGYLCNLFPFPTKTQFDATGVKIIGGEYNIKQLMDACNKEHITRACLTELCDKAWDRKHWLVFATGIQHCIDIADMLNNEFGIHTTYVHSNSKEHPMSDGERDRRIRDYKAGKYQCMVNNGILTTGFDYPEMDCIAMMRKTLSVSLWIQMLGRLTRPLYAPGFDLSTREGRLAAIAASEKPYGLVLDFANNTRCLGPINDPQIPKPKEKKKAGDVPVKTCDSYKLDGQLHIGCGMLNHAAVSNCANCGLEFPKRLKLDLHSSDAELIKRSREEELPKVEVFDISMVTYALHTKRSTDTVSIRVSYHCGHFKLFEEFINIHPGSKAAVRWWKARGGEEVPANNLDALRLLDEGALKKPVAIHVHTNLKYPRIINYDFERTEAPACYSCEKFDKIKETCGKFSDKRPPLKWLLVGCDHWDREIPF